MHVRDAARALCDALDAPEGTIRGEVFNVGATEENYRKLDIVELLKERMPTAPISFVHKDEDPRDYKVSFEKVRSQLGYEPLRRVPDGIDEIVVGLEENAFGDPFDRRYRNT